MNIQERVELVIKGIIGDKPVRLTDHFMRDLRFDSLDTVDLMMDLEEEFQTDITDGEAEGLHTVQDVVTCVESKVHV